MYKCQDDVSFTFWGKPQTLLEQVGFFSVKFWDIMCFLSHFFWHLLLLIPGSFYFPWPDKACTSSSQAPFAFKWRRSPHRCLLGFIISIRWHQWQNPSCYCGLYLPQASWTFTVSISFSFVYGVLVFSFCFYFIPVSQLWILNRLYLCVYF